LPNGRVPLKKSASGERKKNARAPTNPTTLFVSYPFPEGKHENPEKFNAFVNAAELGLRLSD
jgi:DNA segregation ATPase FtsK/SpoIIIE-like protein